MKMNKPNDAKKKQNAMNNNKRHDENKRHDANKRHDENKRDETDMNENLHEASSANAGSERTPREFDSQAQSKDWQSGSEQGGLQGKVMAKITELGDMLERAGEKIEANGFQRIGEAIYRLGDKIERFQDDRDNQADSSADAQHGLKSKVDRSQNLDRKSV